MIYNFDDLSFKVLSVEMFSHKEGCFDVKGRAFGSISLRIEGEGAFEIQEKEFVSKPGDVVFIPKDVPYKVKYTNGTSIAIHFSECNYAEAENISVANKGEVLSLFEAFMKAYAEDCNTNKAKAYVYEILDRLCTHTTIADHELLKIVAFMKENFCNSEFDIKTICSEFFIGRSTLQRKFVKYYNISPKQYILQLRTQKAVKLLTEGEYSVKEIAFFCGFKDEKYFSRAIKERYGQCPSKFMKRFKM